MPGSHVALALRLAKRLPPGGRRGLPLLPRRAPRRHAARHRLAQVPLSPPLLGELLDQLHALAASPAWHLRGSLLLPLQLLIYRGQVTCFGLGSGLESASPDPHPNPNRNQA